MLNATVPESSDFGTPGETGWRRHRRLGRHTPLHGPNRASFAIALNSARDQVVLAAGVIADASIDLAGNIGRLVLAGLMPACRLSTGLRVANRAISKYNACGKVNRATYKPPIDIIAPTSAGDSDP